MTNSVEELELVTTEAFSFDIHFDDLKTKDEQTFEHVKINCKQRLRCKIMKGGKGCDTLRP